MGQGTTGALSPPCCVGSHPALPLPDFSDRIGRTRTTGYEAGEYEMVSGQGAPPPPHAVLGTPLRATGPMGPPGSPAAAPGRASQEPVPAPPWQRRAGLCPVYPSLPLWEPCPDHRVPRVLRSALVTKSWMELGVPGWIWGWTQGSQDNPAWLMFSWVSPGTPRPFLGTPRHVLVLGSVWPHCPLTDSVKFCHPNSLGCPGSSGPSGPSQGGLQSLSSRAKGEKVAEDHLAAWPAQRG